jgi:hypothetical protein
MSCWTKILLLQLYSQQGRQYKYKGNIQARSLSNVAVEKQ